MYSVEQRLRIMEKQLAELQAQLTHRDDHKDTVFHGLVVQIVNAGVTSGGGATSCNFQYLKVIPYPAWGVDSNGSLAFDFPGISPMSGVNGTEPYVKVWPLNVSGDVIGLYYNVGDRISYWRYTGGPNDGTGNGGDPNSTHIAGSYVTIKEDDSFWAKVERQATPASCDPTIPAQMQTYKFTALQWNDAGSFPGYLQTYKCSGSSASLTGDCFNPSEFYLSGTPPTTVTPFLARMYRFLLDSPADNCPNYLYFFFEASQPATGFTGDLELVEDIGWDGTDLTQTTLLIHVKNGLITGTAAGSTTTVATGEDCPPDG